MRYKNIKCEYCQQVFDDNADVVVCPQCGAPHHRDCWNRTGECAHNNEHAAGFIWRFPEMPEAQKQDSQPKPAGEFIFKNGEGVIKCPACGADNYENDMFCMRCHAPLRAVSNNDNPTADYTSGAPIVFPDNMGGNSGDNNNWQNSGSQNAGGFNNNGGFNNGGNGQGYGDNGYFEYVNRFGGLDPDSLLDGIPVIEYSDYVGGAKPGRILRRISVMERFGKNISWCWPAIFFGPVWFLWRKMKKQGFIIFAVLLAVSLTAGLLSITAPFKTFCKDSYNLISEFASGEVSREDFMTEYQEISNIYAYAELTSEEEAKLNVVSVLTYVAEIGIPLVCSMLSMQMYRKKAKKDILDVRSQCSNMQSYRQMLIKKGGTSVGLCVLGVVLLVLSYMCMSYLPMFIVMLSAL